ncbi:MAG TPA: cytochrome c biogenesis protein ResB [Bacteroidales bacterium]|jgi:hypothetical protein|nr:cytochrome c biogenesis protein ResB [Bacteroidales bacterium]HNZ43323.1 cytochrome c biogenesis protein ResB [Bacteroidales bacterium]HOH84167.1 cytochrome c biogenesis protein ResB [Bacteroidales bacterium]HPB26038.1 cytochrome c biogenesis protein ResB [Bacteroidales bacterium]HPI31592.1 cytochrome c biogenesis protein ResB [Bacteroidales bacterium]
MIDNPSSERKFGKFPWKYAESFLVSCSLVFIGFIIEFATGGKGVRLPGFPANLLLLSLFIVYIAIFHFLVKHPVKKWLCSVHAAISAISVFAVLILLMGIVPQLPNKGNDLIDKLGISHIVQSWPFFISCTYLLFVLSFIIVKRAFPLTLKNIAFTFNHLGLWIVLAAGSLGASDTMEFTMMLTKGKETYVAYDQRGKAYDVGFRLELISFSIDEYPPELGLFDYKTGKSADAKATRPIVKKGGTAIMGDWKIEISDFIENAQKDSTGYLPAVNPGAPAAYVKAVHRLNKAVVNGWVSSGSPFVYRDDLQLSDNKFIAMTLRKPRKYISDVMAFYDGDQKTNFQLTVNNPYKFKGWTIYQSGYDEQMGKWSEISIIRLVRDPWLPVVYTGIFMLLAGALLMLWTGRSGIIKNKPQYDLG